MPTRYEEMFKVLPEIAPCSVAAGSLAKKAFDLMGEYHRTEKDMVSANNIGTIEIGDIESSPLSSRYGPRLTLERSDIDARVGYVSIVRGRALARIAMLTTLGDGPCNFVAFGDPDTEIGSMEVTNDQSDIDRATRLELIAAISDEIDYRLDHLSGKTISMQKRADTHEVGFEVKEALRETPTKDTLDRQQSEKDFRGLNPTFYNYLRTRYQEVFGREYDDEEYRLLDTISDYTGWRFEVSVETKEDLGNGVPYDGTLTYRADIKSSDDDTSRLCYIELGVRPDALPDAKFSQIAAFEADPAGTIRDISNISKIKDLDADEIRFLRSIVNSKNKTERLHVTFQPIPEDKIPRTGVLNRPSSEYGENGVLPPKLQEMFDLASWISVAVKQDYRSSKNGRVDNLKTTGRRLQKNLCLSINGIPSLSAGEQAKRMQTIHDVLAAYRADEFSRPGYWSVRDVLDQIIEMTRDLGAVDKSEEQVRGITRLGMFGHTNDNDLRSMGQDRAASTMSWDVSEYHDSTYVHKKRSSV